MNAANEVFSITELLELILLSLPCDNVHQELGSIKTITRCQTTCRTWHTLVQNSTPIRQRLYLPTAIDASDATTWNDKHAYPPARPNPWIPDLLLNQRSWGSAYPFEIQHHHTTTPHQQPRHWTFSFEISALQHQRLPADDGRWRDMLLASPPFTHVWYTRSFYELGSGRAPFVTHLDYDPRKPKSRQRYSAHCPGGVTLGHVCDAVRELFARHAQTKFVMVESVRVWDGGDGDAEGELDLSLDRPTTRSYVPGMSAEKAHGWYRGQ